MPLTHQQLESFQALRDDVRQKLVTPTYKDPLRPGMLLGANFLRIYPILHEADQLQAEVVRLQTQLADTEKGIALDGAAQLLGLDIFAYTPGDVYRAISELQATALFHAGCELDLAAARLHHDQGATDHGHAS